MLQIIKKLNGKTFTVVGITLGLVIVLYFYGCESRTCSILDPQRQVTRAELQAEVAMYEARLLDRSRDLDRKDSVKKFLSEQLSVVASGGGVNPIGALNSLATILAVGYAVDANRKVKKAKTISGGDAV